MMAAPGFVERSCTAAVSRAAGNGELFAADAVVDVEEVVGVNFPLDLQ